MPMHAQCIIESVVVLVSHLGPYIPIGSRIGDATMATCNVYVCCAVPVLFVQWELSIEYTIGTQRAVLYREVSLIQR